MNFIKIQPNNNGSHNNLSNFNLTIPPEEGWAVIPESVGTPSTLENFPFGTITVVDVDGVPTVASWVPGEIPETPTYDPPPSQLDKVEAQATYTAMMTDTLLEEV